jgi:hypothetical protein
MKQHDPSEACEETHCYSHNVDESGYGYRRCFECWHLYRTERALLWSWRWQMWLSARTYEGWIKSAHGLLTQYKKAEQINFCAHCAHDF